MAQILSSRHIDHVVLAAHDLDAHAQFFRHLGFVVGARNRHPWGTQNHIIQFDGSFIELIGIDKSFHVASDPDPHQFSFSGFVGQYLSQHEGAAMLALTSENAEADARAFRVMGIGDFEPFHFERRGKRPDGSAVNVAFTLAFARSPLIPDAGFFSCQHHYPENFWDTSHRAHANGAASLLGVTMVAENPADHGEFLSHLTGARAFSASSAGLGFDLGDPPAQRLDVLTPQAFRQRYGDAALSDAAPMPGLAACTIEVRDRSALLAALDGSRTSYEERAGCIVLAPPQVFGVALIFRTDA